MNIEQLGRKLRREITANPKKAAVLGLLTLVALYFWAPLVSGMFGGPTTDSPAPLAAEVAPTTVPIDGTTAATTRASSTPTPPSWQQLLAWIESDPRTKPASEQLFARDPFGANQLPAKTNEKSAQELIVEAAADIEPNAANLTLSTTIVGRERRVARINGKTYLEGQTVRSNGELGGVDFVVVEVKPRMVVLERNGKQYQLKIPSPLDNAEESH